MFKDTKGIIKNSNSVYNSEAVNLVISIIDEEVGPPFVEITIRSFPHS
jgi:hypothetical protein